MMFRTFAEIESKIRSGQHRKRLVVANAHDHEVLTAVIMAAERDTVAPILLGNGDKIREILSDMGKKPDQYPIIETETEADSARKAMEMVASGEADIPMKGLMQTSTFMKALLNKEFGFVPEGALINQATVLEWPEQNRMMVFGDCAINIAPDLNDKVKILRNMIVLARCLGIPSPKAAVVSAVEVVKEKIPSTVDAAAISAMDWGDCDVFGPLALDNAVSLEAAKHKGIDNPVAGRADILLLPDLCTGNVFTKSMTFFAHLESAGAVCGTKIPVVMSSRTDTAENKFHSILVAILQAGS